MIFVYGGYDVVPVPAGEAVDPKRHVPFALVATILTVMSVMTLTQLVAQSVLPDLAAHSTPIADAAAVFLGASGALNSTRFRPLTLARYSASSARETKVAEVSPSAY